MGAWIEIFSTTGKTMEQVTAKSHPTMGAWIEILLPICYLFQLNRRTPRWVRGLKYGILENYNKVVIVAPHDGCVD